jgi:fructose-1,6-bisphosphatase/inositol monophosphatase family enzyme
MSDFDFDSNNKFNDAYLRTGLIAVSDAIWAGLRVLSLPWTASVRTTSRFKATDRQIEDDPTDPIDEEARTAISEVLQKAAKTSKHPLSRGFLVHDEETGFHQYAGIAGGREENILVLIDPVDGTSSAKRGLDGSTLISFFDRYTGLCAAVMGDIFRRTIYWRKAGDSTKAMVIKHSQDPTYDFLSTVAGGVMPMGEPLELKPSKQQSLQGASLNIYMGKPERIIKAYEIGKALWNPHLGIKEIFSFGGSLGSVRVGQGLWDASIEIAKGFRPWDFLPGAFLAQGAGATVVDMEGHDLTFGPEILNEDYIKAKFEGEALEACRKKFIVASTKELATQIVEILNKNVNNQKSINKENIKKVKQRHSRRPTMA